MENEKVTFNKFGYHQRVRVRDTGGVRPEYRKEIGKVEGITRWHDGSYSYDLQFPEKAARRFPEILLEPVRE